jgi:hypothetical protein
MGSRQRDAVGLLTLVSEINRLLEEQSKEARRQ